MASSVAAFPKYPDAGYFLFGQRSALSFGSPESQRSPHPLLIRHVTAHLRLEGPWTEDDFRLDEPPVLTRQLRTMHGHGFRPWQTFMESKLQQVDDRKIYLIHDRVGNTGKSIFAEHLEYKGIATEVPPFAKLEDMMACVLAARNKRAFIIDMPRGLARNNHAELFAGIETLKNGLAYDRRYKFKKQRFDRPQVLVFVNRFPPFQLLSEDRWAIFNMLPTHELEELSIAQAVALQAAIDREAVGPAAPPDMPAALPAAAPEGPAGEAPDAPAAAAVDGAVAVAPELAPAVEIAPAPAPDAAAVPMYFGGLDDEEVDFVAGPDPEDEFVQGPEFEAEFFQ